MQMLPRAPIRQFFATVPVPCPYLADKVEQKLVVELAGSDVGCFYGQLSQGGFRRSHTLAYRPACRDCTACVPVRIAATGFAPSRSLRRIRNRNADLAAAPLRPVATDEQFRLFQAYQRARHGSSDMAAMTRTDYRAMVEETAVDTVIVEFRDGAGALVAACLADRLPDGLSAVYSFFDPAQPRRSLGTYMILWLLEHADAQGLAFVYLGYWVGGSDTMDYKRRFPALEGLIEGAWRRL